MSQLGAPLRVGEACSFRSFRTNNYKLHFLESPSGFKVDTCSFHHGLTCACALFAW